MARATGKPSNRKSPNSDPPGLLKVAGYVHNFSVPDLTSFPQSNFEFSLRERNDKTGKEIGVFYLYPSWRPHPEPGQVAYPTTPFGEVAALVVTSAFFQGHKITVFYDQPLNTEGHIGGFVRMVSVYADE